MGKYQESHVREMGMLILDPGGKNLDNTIHEPLVHKLENAYEPFDMRPEIRT